MTKFLQLRQAVGSPELVDPTCKVDTNYLKKNAKLERLLSLLADITSRNEKVIVYSNWIEPLRMIYSHLAKTYDVCYYTGSMNEADRQRNKTKFMTDPSAKIMLGTIGALGTSHTLTAAIPFYDGARCV